MTEFATRTVFPFEALARAVDMVTVAISYATPAVFREKLADLASLKYIRGSARYQLVLSAASAGGTAKVRLTDGTNILVEDTLTLSAATTFAAAVDVNLSPVAGSAPLRWEVEVTAAGDAGLTADFSGQLLADHPLVIGSC